MNTAAVTIKSTVKYDADGIHVSAVCTSHPHVPFRSGYGLRDTPSNRRLVQRLMKAIDAGIVYGDLEIRRDVYNDEYVSCSNYRVMGRTMNADLKRYGF